MSVPSAIIDDMDDIDDMDAQDPDGRHDPPTIEELATNLNDLKAELAKAKRSVVWEAVACSAVIATVLALIVGAVSTLWRDQGPTTADDNLDQLLRPGPHCYNSSAEMAAARQRALTAIDRIRWERHFTQRFESEHPQPAQEPVSMIPPNVPVEPPPPPLPMILGPKDPGVPASSDPHLSIRGDLCFGIPNPAV